MHVFPEGESHVDDEKKGRSGIIRLGAIKDIISKVMMIKMTPPPPPRPRPFIPAAGPAKITTMPLCWKLTITIAYPDRWSTSDSLRFSLKLLKLHFFQFRKLCVWGRTWNLIVLVSDHCLFICLYFCVLAKKILGLLNLRFEQYGFTIWARHEKTCLCHLRTTKAQISLHIRAGWSAPLLFAT